MEGIVFGNKVIFCSYLVWLLVKTMNRRDFVCDVWRSYIIQNNSKSEKEWQNFYYDLANYVGLQKCSWFLSRYLRTWNVLLNTSVCILENRNKIKLLYDFDDIEEDIRLICFKDPLMLVTSYWLTIIPTRPQFQIGVILLH